MQAPCSERSAEAKHDDAGGAAEEEAAVPPPSEDVVYALACNMCRGNKFVLCVAEDLMQDDINNSPGMPRRTGCAWNNPYVHTVHNDADATKNTCCTDCGSYFLENVKSWMEECAASIEGKLNCPGCRSAHALGTCKCMPDGAVLIRTLDGLLDCISALNRARLNALSSFTIFPQRTRGTNQLGRI